MSMEDTNRWFRPADLLCKSPYGAVPSDAQVRFTLRPQRQEAFVRGILRARWEFDGDRVTETILPWVGMEKGQDLFSGVLEPANYVGLIWYSLRLERSDGSREETEEYQLTVYDTDEHVPAWFGEGVTYQIFPDRFRRLSVPDPTGMVGGRQVHQDWQEEPVYLPNEHGEIRNRDFMGDGVWEKRKP